MQNSSARGRVCRNTIFGQQLRSAEINYTRGTQLRVSSESSHFYHAAGVALARGWNYKTSFIPVKLSCYFSEAFFLTRGLQTRGVSKLFSPRATLDIRLVSRGPH